MLKRKALQLAVSFGMAAMSGAVYANGSDMTNPDSGVLAYDSIGQVKRTQTPP